MKMKIKVKSIVNDLDTQDFRVSQEKKPCIRLTQENLVDLIYSNLMIYANYF